MNSKQLITVIVLTLLGVAGGFVAGTVYTDAERNAQIASHDLLAKRLFVSGPSDTILNFEPLREDMRQDLKYYDGDISVYFEYLPTGTSIKMGDSMQLVAASLLKVPVAMEVYRLSEQAKVNLNAKVTIKEQWLDSQYGDLYKKGAGYELTIKDLIRYMLVDSDNTALNALQDVVSTSRDPEDDTNAYDALDINYEDKENTKLSLSARSYASFLKCLYFACYVSPDSSQEILHHLTHSTNGVAERMSKYIPDNVVIAHKIGVAGEQTQADCGVVYVPNRNYILCIMINESKLKGSEVIAQTSKKVFDYVNSR